jgi:hypothetical protein
VPLGLHDALVALVLRAAERRLVGGRAQAEKKPWSEGMMLVTERDPSSPSRRATDEPYQLTILMTSFPQHSPSSFYTHIQTGVSISSRQHAWKIRPGRPGWLLIAYM